VHPLEPEVIERDVGIARGEAAAPRVMSRMARPRVASVADGLAEEGVESKLVLGGVEEHRVDVTGILDDPGVEGDARVFGCPDESVRVGDEGGLVQLPMRDEDMAITHAGDFLEHRV